MEILLKRWNTPEREDSAIAIAGLRTADRIFWTWGKYSDVGDEKQITASLQSSVNKAQAAIGIVGNSVYLVLPGEPEIKLGSISAADKDQIEKLKEDVTPRFNPFGYILYDLAINLELDPTIRSISTEDSTGIEWNVWRWSAIGSSRPDADKFRWRYESLKIDNGGLPIDLKQRMAQLSFKDKPGVFYDQSVGLDLAPMMRSVSAKVIRPLWSKCMNLLSSRTGK